MCASGHLGRARYKGRAPHSQHLPLFRGFRLALSTNPPLPLMPFPSRLLFCLLIKLRRLVVQTGKNGLLVKANRMLIGFGRCLGGMCGTAEIVPAGEEDVGDAVDPSPPVQKMRCRLLNPTALGAAKLGRSLESVRLPRLCGTRRTGQGSSPRATVDRANNARIGLL
mmetsp:Transcript_103041/g.204535  ORF Transcript_103041/g.204535 Transcript_103041/m.204535 type:complete len:167 (-) Transcript_103041:34-534(-)